jgi:PAS domain S-box-containing protein
MITDSDIAAGVFDASPDCVKLLDLDGRLLAMNENGRCAMEIEDFNSLCGKPWVTFWPEENHQAVHDALDAARAGRIGHFNAFCPTAKGIPKWWDVKVTPLANRQGKVRNLLSVSHDVTALHQANKELRVNEERFRLLISATSAIVWTASPSGEFKGEQPSWSAFTGQSADALRGWGWLDAIYPNDRENTMAAWDRAVSSNTSYEVEYRLRRADEKYRWMSAKAVPAIGLDGNIREWVGIHTDITDRKRAEAQEKRAAAEAAAAAEANAKYRIFFEQGPYFAGVMSLDGTVLEANRLCLDACGFTSEEIIGRKFWECGWWNRSPALMEMVQAGCLQAASGTIFRQETKYFISDGTERVVDLVMAPVTDKNGKVLFIAPTGTDITERKQVEERLRLLNAMNEIIRVAADPKIIMVEVPRLLGEYLNVTRCAYADLEPDNDQFTIRHDWTAAGAMSTVGTYSLNLFGLQVAADLREGRVLVIRDVDRELAPSEGANMFNAIGIKALICCPLVKDGRLVAMMALHQAAPRDWTADNVALLEEVAERSWVHIERVRAFEVLQEDDRRKTEFLAVLAHELRNPLAPIRNGLQVMRLAADNPATIARVRDVMERQLVHLVHLVDDLLDIARVTRGKVDLQKEHVELRNVVASAVETSLLSIEARRHELNLHIPEESFPLYVDPTRISQVISNLLTNAAKYTPSGGRIDLSARKDGNEVVLSLTDTGVGLAPESLSRVFDMFTQVGQTIEHAQGGLGIGLALVRRLVELHDGTVAATSPGVGKGSTCSVRLPLAENRSVQSGPVPDQNGKTNQSAGRFRILVVDDNADAAETMSAFLKIAGHTIQTANNGYRALELVQTFNPEIIFLDIGMPGMNGYEVAREIRNMREMEEVMLVALTGWGAEADRVRTSNTGFDQHLTKPASFAAINTLLTDLARRCAQ